MPASHVSRISASWQVELRQAHTRLPELLAALGLRPEDCGVSEAAAASFPLRVPREYMARMHPGDARDPLLLQVLPAAAELVAAAGFGTDPVGDLVSVRAPGLLQKYAGRALLITTGACAVHCRYCFRREFPYAEHGGAALGAALEALAADSGVREVILSGGDPLMLSDRRLDQLLQRIGALGHVERIRIHTRLPIVLPSRVTTGLLRVFRRASRPLVLVVHANHPHEIDAAVTRALLHLREGCRAVLNQSVLLRGVNDDAGALAELSTRLFAAGVLPYYLHQLDRVTGTTHFAVDDGDARAIAAALARRLPGYLVPRLVREVRGAPAKMPLMPDITGASPHNRTTVT